MSWQLEVTGGPDQATKLALTGTVLNIGRDPGLGGLVLSDSAVSRQHARITVNADGKVYIEDMGSSYGTFVNNTEVNGPVEISPQDQISLGNTRIVLVSAPQAAEFSTQVESAQSVVVISIGRDSNNDLVVSDPNVSRKHARLEQHRDACYLTDLNSTQGTYLNGVPVQGTVLIRPESWIQVSGYSYLFDGTRLLTEEGEVAAAFSSFPGQKVRSVNYSKALTAPFGGQESLKWLLGSILAILPIADFLAGGYRYRLLQNGQSGKITMPEWDHWGEMFVKGLLFFLVRVGYFIIPLLFTLFVIVLIRYSAEAIYSILGALFFINLLLYALASFVMPMGLANFAATGNFKDAFSLQDVIQTIRADFGQYLAVVMMVAGFWSLVIILALIPYIGFVFGVLGYFYVYIVSALLFGQVYRQSRLA